MNRFLLVIQIMSFCFAVKGQNLHGLVTDAKNNPLPGANIYIKGSYDGATTDTLGKYEFKTSLTGSQVIVVSHIGFENFEININLSQSNQSPEVIILKEKNTQLNDVVITAGTFEAGDKKRGIQLKALDILTTPNSNGDIFRGLGTLPGVQTVGEEGALFVRGGEQNETKTFVDGMLVSNPYTSKVPDLPERGRFSPSLFSGVSFSSGGYSAEYGQALSSALILQTYAYPTKSLTSISIFPFGAGINRTWKGDSTAFTIDVDYNNMLPYNSIVKQDITWKHNPETLQSTAMFRKKVGKTGFIKSFGSFSSNKLGLVLPEYNAYDGNTHFNLADNNIYLNTVYTATVFKQWSLKTGGSFNFDDNLIRFEHFSVNTHNRIAQFRVTLQNSISNKLSVKTGGEFDYQNYNQQYAQQDSAVDYHLHYKSPIIAVFLEAEWKISKRLFARLGSRLEYAGLIQEISLVPRFSLAYKTGEYDQVSLAYGIFSELPKDDYLKFNPSLSSEKATHYIVNYQYTKNKRSFRIEAFSKEYHKLVRYTELNDPDPQHYNNKGYGYARGIELFLRDQKTLQNGDYWVSYTFLDTRKLYKDLPSFETPYLFSKHSLSVVGKYFVTKLHTQFGLTYQYASGRPYYAPGAEAGQEHYTIDYHNVSMNLSYLTSLWNCFTIVHFSVSNVLGFNQIFSYNYSKLPDSSGNYTIYPIKPAAKRFFVLGVFITLDKNYIQY